MKQGEQQFIFITHKIQTPAMVKCQDEILKMDISHIIVL